MRESTSQSDGQSCPSKVKVSKFELECVLPTIPKSEWTLQCCSGWTDVDVEAIIDCDDIPVQEATSSFLCSGTNMTARYCPNKKLHISLQGFTLLGGMETERSIHVRRHRTIQERVVICDLHFLVILNQVWHAKDISVPGVHTQDRAQEMEELLYRCRKLYSIQEYYWMFIVQV
jgi:hypothetical protein